MPEFVASLVFCQCGSDRVEIRVWQGRRARIYCITCNQESWLDGFTLSPLDLGKLLSGAIVDQARKHRHPFTGGGSGPSEGEDQASVEA